MNLILLFIKSKIIIIYLKILGIKISFKTQIYNFPRLKIRGEAKNIVIGKVLILGEIDLRNRESGKIIFKDGCRIESNCRFVSAREGTVQVGSNTLVTMGAIINGGADVIIGSNCILGPRISINANEHVFKKNKLINTQGFIHKSVFIEDDCWFGANVVVNKGVCIKFGSVVGAQSLVNKDTEINSINAGVPARKISEREE